MSAQPGSGRAREPCLLGAVDRELGTTEGRRPSRLHLHEGDEPSSSHDEIDLDAPDPDVAFDDAIPSSCQKTCGAQLAFRAEGTPVVIVLHLLDSTGPGD